MLNYVVMKKDNYIFADDLAVDHLSLPSSLNIVQGGWDCWNSSSAIFGKLQHSHSFSTALNTVKQVNIPR